MPGKHDTASPRMLTSWKEIAAFFGRDISTVQRWERDRGLPVHRHPHRSRSSVYAYPEALAAWQASHGAAITDGNGPQASRPSRWRFAPGSPRVRAAALIAGLVMLAGGGLLWLVQPAAHSVPPVIEVASLTSAVPLAVDSIDDLNGDGRGDLVVHSYGGPEFAIYFAGTHPEPRLRPDVRITASGVASVQGGSMGDVDGDGIADLVISTVFGEPETYTATAPSYLIKGRKEWPKELHLPLDADTRFEGRFENGDIRMGVCVTPGGLDLNADGLRDIVVGGRDFSPPDMPSAGGVFVLFGRRAWPDRVDVVTDADVAIHGSRIGEALSPGCAVGDFTSDGRADLALVATEDSLWYMQGGRGRVYLFAGRPEWPRLIQAGDGAVLQLRGAAERAHLTPPLLADINGDGAADLVAGFSHEPDSGVDGRVVAVLGTRDPRGVIREDHADVIIRGGAMFGRTVAAADFTRDGRADVVVADPGTGQVLMLAGRERFERRGSFAAYGPITLGLGGPGSGLYGLAWSTRDPQQIVLDMTPGPQPNLRRLVRLAPPQLSTSAAALGTK